MSEKNSYRPEIDGLRALAVIAVIINHFNGDILPSGYLGVDIFFVISGFVITSSLANRPSKNLGDFLVEFYVRRLKRLVPALALCVLITSILICLFSPDPQVSLRTGIAALFGLSNLYLLRQSTNYFAASTELNVFTHTWSLGVEEQFYFLFPILAWFTGICHLTAKRSKILFGIIGILSVASLLAFIHLYKINQPAAYFLMPTRFWEMGTGCLLFLCLNNLKHRKRNYCIPSSLIVAAIILAFFIPLKFASKATIIIVGLTAILILIIRSDSFSYKLISHPKVIYLGLISYSLYLWHWSVLSLSRWTIGIHWWSVPIQICLILLLSVISYHYVETPLRLKTWSNIQWKTITYGVGVSVCTAGIIGLIAKIFSYQLFLLLNSPYIIKDPLYVNRPYVYEKPDINSARCMLPQSSSKRIVDLIRDCSIHFTNRRQTVFLLGDSQSNHLKGLGGLLNSQLGLGVQMLSVSATNYPPVRYQSITITRSLNRARISVQQDIVDNSIELAKPGDIFILSGRYIAYFNDIKITLDERSQMIDRYSATGKLIPPSVALDEWLKQLDDFLLKLNKRDIQVILMLPFPEFPYSGSRCLSPWSHFQFETICSFDRKEFLSKRDLFVEKISSLATRHKNLNIYDPFPILCPIEEKCSTLDGKGKLLYYDAIHLSTYGSRFLYDDFSNFLHYHKLLKTPNYSFKK